MTDTNHRNELLTLKSKAFQILADEGVLSAIETLMEGKNDDDLLEKVNSPIKAIASKTDIEAEHKDRIWKHHAYLLDGIQTVQISYCTVPLGLTEEYGKRARLYIFHNDKLVLCDTGSTVKRTEDGRTEPWRFDRGRTFELQVAKLDKSWMEALKEIVNELGRDAELRAKEFRKKQEERAEKEKSNFDLGEFD